MDFKTYRIPWVCMGLCLFFWILTSVEDCCSNQFEAANVDLCSKKADQINKEIANKNILTKQNEALDKVYVEASAAFDKERDSIDAGPNLVMPQGIKIELLNSSRLWVTGTFIERKNDLAVVEISIFEKKDNIVLLLETRRITEWQVSEVSTYKYIRINYPDFIFLLVASFDELVETKVCYNS